jgi:hypothetical protein
MKKTTTFKKDDIIPVTNTDKDDESVKNPDGEQPNMEGAGRSYIPLSPEECSHHKSNKENLLKHETKTNTRKMLEKKNKSSVKLKWLSFII